MHPPPRFAGVPDPDALRAVFHGAGFTEAGLANIPDLALGDAALRSGRLDPREGARTPAALLARLFVLGASVPVGDVHALLGRGAADALRAAGLIAGDPDYRALVAVTPVGDRLLAHDRRDTHVDGAAEFVPGPGPATRRFAEVAVRRAGARVLDLGCGQGLLALLAAEAGGEVTASDVSPRAVAFAEFNARLNGIETIRCVQGDLVAAVAGRSFDVILANPPYVISPDATFLYRDSRGICERIAREGPALLAEGGILQMTCHWPHHRGAAWQEELASWFAESGCDVWVLQTDHLDCATYAATWLRQAHADATDCAAAFDRWTAWYEASGIDAIGGGVASMRRRRAGGATTPPWFQIRDMPPAAGPCGESIARVLEAREVLARFDDAAVLDARVALAPEARALATRRPSASGWQQESYELRLQRGLALALRVDPIGHALVGYLDGTCPVREVVATFATAAGLPAEILRAQAPALLRRLLEMGLAHVVAPDG